MNPIGLVTCYFHHNYGSMLQAYATEMVMQKMHVPYLTIACKRPKDYMRANSLLYIVKKLLVGDWKMWYGKKKIAQKAKEDALFAENVRIRNAMFDDFSSLFFHVSKLAKDRRELEKMAEDFSAFLVGSDQLWRTDSVEHGYYTLEWVPDNIRKIAYSTSIGVKKIPWFQIEKNRRFMNRFDYVALREQSACDIYHQLTGKDAKVVLDPTLLFTGDEWLPIQSMNPLTEGKYIFVYLLGNNPDQREYVNPSLTPPVKFSEKNRVVLRFFRSRKPLFRRFAFLFLNCSTSPFGKIVVPLHPRCTSYQRYVTTVRLILTSATTASRSPSATWQAASTAAFC